MSDIYVDSANLNHLRWGSGKDGCDVVDGDRGGSRVPTPDSSCAVVRGGTKPSPGGKEGIAGHICVCLSIGEPNRKICVPMENSGNQPEPGIYGFIIGSSLKVIETEDIEDG